MLPFKGKIQASSNRVRGLLSSFLSVGMDVAHETAVPRIGKHAQLICLVFFVVFIRSLGLCVTPSDDLSSLKRDQELLDFRVANLYCDSKGQIVGAKFWHEPTGAPIFFFQSDGVPQVFIWVDTPAESEEGLAHALEHLLVGKGTKGRYSSLLKEMRLSQSTAATAQGYNYYSFSSGSGLTGFFEQFHAWLDALYRPDFTDAEAEREFYNFGVITRATTKGKTLVEKGTVYDEILGRQGMWSYYYASNRLTLGDQNPFVFDPGGVPDKMRRVTNDEIRRFYNQHYQFGPSAGFIFIVSPRVNVTTFLDRVSSELRFFYKPSSRSNASATVS